MTWKAVTQKTLSWGKVLEESLKSFETLYISLNATMYQPVLSRCEPLIPALDLQGYFQ